MKISFRIWPGLVLGIWICLTAPSASARDLTYTWMVLEPQNDSREKEVRDFDEYLSQSTLLTMNEHEKVFLHRLVWQKEPLSRLLANSTPFCELIFDAIKPLILTHEEKATLKEYFARGGFLLLTEDAYPYPQDEFRKVRSWPIVDFLTKELAADDHNFTFEKITEQHILFHQYHKTSIPTDELHELQENPYSPCLTLISYRGHPCAFIVAQYSSLDNHGKWIALPRPFDRRLSPDLDGYELTVNIYIYTTMH